MTSRTAGRVNPARAASWLLLAGVLVATLAVGSRDPFPPTEAERVEHITESIRCPTCRSQSVADSDAPAARAVRDETLRRVQEGQSDEEIVSYLVARYGNDIVLDPPAQGVSALVWILPVVGVAATVVALAVAFRRWRPSGRRVSDEDRALVERAFHEQS